jgi:serine/threonine kinase 32
MPVLFQSKLWFAKLPQPVDFDGDVTLFHFVLLRSVGKGAFGKVSVAPGAVPFFRPVKRIHLCDVATPFQVRVVQHKQTRDLYALKYINKAKCVKMKAVANIIQERRLLEEVTYASSFSTHLILPQGAQQTDRPSIRGEPTLRVSRRRELLLRSRSDARWRSTMCVPNRCLSHVTGFIDKAPITVHLERLGSMSEDAVRFYVAEIASALTFLHGKRIIHR